MLFAVKDDHRESFPQIKPGAVAQSSLFFIPGCGGCDKEWMVLPKTIVLHPSERVNLSIQNES